MNTGNKIEPSQSTAEEDLQWTSHSPSNRRKHPLWSTKTGYAQDQSSVQRNTERGLTYPICTHHTLCIPIQTRLSFGRGNRVHSILQRRALILISDIPFIVLLLSVRCCESSLHFMSVHWFTVFWILLHMELSVVAIAERNHAKSPSYLNLCSREGSMEVQQLIEKVFHCNHGRVIL